MRRPLAGIALALLVGAVAMPVRATTLRIARVRSGDVVASGLQIATAPGPDQAPALELRLAKLDGGVPGSGWSDLRWSCPLRIAADGGWHCEGALRARRDGGAVRGRLRLGHAGDGPYARLTAGDARIGARTAGQAVQLEWQRVPIEWLAPTITAALPELRGFGGELDGTATVDSGARGSTASGELVARGAAFDSAAGNVAGAGLGLSSSWRLARGARTELALESRVEAGELLYAPVYLKVPGSGIDVDLRFERDDAAAWSLARWSIEDAGVLSAGGSAAWQADGALARLEVERVHAELGTALPRYANGALALVGLDGLHARGTLDAALRWARAGPLAAHAELQLDSLEDGAGRFGVDAAQASLSVGEPGTPPSQLSWQGAQLYRVPIGAGSVRFAHDGAGVTLLEPATLPVAGGRLVLEAAQRRIVGDASEWSGALRVEAIELAPLTEAFGWPRFGGTLSGRVPALRGSGGRVVLEGTLEAEVFDGRAQVSGLEVERLFGVAPSLAATVGFDDLDLGLVTGAFDFGSIEGRLDGRIDGLRLLDWSPVAFDAVLRTDRAQRGKRRISQRAVNNLSAVGGGAAGIQQGVLKFFDSFGYAEIGLSCRLADNVCSMGGLDSADGGYTIVRGSGLPHLTVVGHQRRVDWPTLVARLTEAVAGTRPVIR